MGDARFDVGREKADSSAPSTYEAPRLTEIGSVHSLTLNHNDRCFWGKKWGGVDGIEFMNITIPVSSC